MIKTIDQFLKEVITEMRKKSYMEVPPMLEQVGLATLKLRFRIKNVKKGFIQFYYNQDNGKISMAIVVGGKRIYGHNCIPGLGWHRHLPPDGRHDYSANARKPVSIKEFVEQMDKIVKKCTRK